MKILYNWLKEFVDVKAPAKDLASRLSMAGLAIDSIEESEAGPVLDAEVTANRADCLGVYGVAREAAAIYRLTVKPLRPGLQQGRQPVATAAGVTIEAPEVCGRYTARVMRGVKVQPSPDWLQQRLAAIGLNSINNVVDATNYVMLELGQPMHAFDLDKLADKRVIVRLARANEKIKTLDGMDRSLTEQMCVIADAARAIAIAGVVGGAESEIGFATRDILIESAWFDPISIRRTAKALGVRTEASYRFERGADPEMAEIASRRAAELIQQMAGGELLAGAIDLYPGRAPEQRVVFAREELLRLMGADIPDRDIEEILGALGFHPMRSDEHRGAADSLLATWECRRPSWRQDVRRGIDLIEEVARHYGYEKFPPRLPAAKQAAKRLPNAAAMDRLRERVIGLGYQEIVEIPIVDAARDAIFRPQGVTPAKIGNPLAENASVMRSSGVVSMINAIEWNLNHGQRNLRLFEVGRTYQMRDGEPVETPVLTLGLTGLAQEKTIHDEARGFSFADMKGDLDQIAKLAGGAQWQKAQKTWMGGGGGAEISFRGERSDRRPAVAGQLGQKIADQLKLRQDIFVAEVPLEPLLEAMEKSKAALQFMPIPRFPIVERDFSVVLTDGLAFARVEAAIRSLGIGELKKVEAADLFRGGQVPAGKYSLMVRVTFQSAETTLTDAQVANYSARIVGVLENELGATLRAS